jgi:hypothetical protein
MFTSRHKIIPGNNNQTMIAVNLLSLVKILLFYTMNIVNKKISIAPMHEWPPMPFASFQQHMEMALSKIEGVSYEWNSQFQYWHIEFGASPLDDAWIAVDDKTRKWCQIIMHFKDEDEDEDEDIIPHNISDSCLKCLEEGQRCECYKPKPRGATIFFDRVIGSELSYHFILCELCSYFDDLLHGRSSTASSGNLMF